MQTFFVFGSSGLLRGGPLRRGEVRRRERQRLKQVMVFE